MAIASLDTRDEKLAWLLKPFNLASDAVFLALFFLGVAIYDGDAGWIVKVEMGFAGLMLVAALAFLLWGIRRMSQAAGKL